ncbi:MAG: hypothetical protein GF398_03070 [Chitinivibrionales bacterium]|nr:hypothetical protein [Chitinivibrionales bacterium]
MKADLPVMALLLCLPAFCAPESRQRLGDDLSIGGRIVYLPSIYLNDTSSNWITGAGLHNRLEGAWYATDRLTLHAGWRNRLVYGEQVEEVPGYQERLTGRRGMIDLTAKLAEGASYTAYTQLDRIYADVFVRDWQVRIGRQRVNWGINLVWAPHDIFYAAQYVDFDYPEGAGIDAVSLRYYPAATSSVEAVVEGARDADSISAAILGKVNVSKYDIQVLAGFVDGDLAAGAGISGAIGGAAVRGAATILHPRRSLEDTQTTVIAALSSDYTWPNGFYLHGSALVNSDGEWGKPGRQFPLRAGDVSVRNLTPSLLTLFAQVSHPLTPLLGVDIAAMTNPADGSVLVYPSINYSLHQHLDVALIGLLFFGERGALFGVAHKQIYARAAYHF